jgi:hypothetical protein
MTQATTLNSCATPYGNVCHETYGDPMQSVFTFYRTDSKNEPLTRAQVGEIIETTIDAFCDPYDMTGQETTKFAIDLVLFRAKLDQNKYETAPSWKDIMIKD